MILWCAISQRNAQRSFIRISCFVPRTWVTVYHEDCLYITQFIILTHSRDFSSSLAALAALSRPDGSKLLQTGAALVPSFSELSSFVPPSPPLLSSPPEGTPGICGGPSPGGGGLLTPNNQDIKKEGDRYELRKFFDNFPSDVWCKFSHVQSLRTGSLVFTPMGMSTVWENCGSMRMTSRPSLPRGKGR